ncbi:hypothetical protein BN406_05886 (plasmid) [Sinorhizobium meliloti Rm41]|nr:hypothetical protein BN406_05886 [Sinorhizobium meliloti Rm41]
MPADAILDAKLCGKRLEPAGELSRTDMLEAPVDIRRQQRQRLQEDVISLLGNGAPDADDAHRIVGIRAVAPGMLAFEGRETIEIEAVIAQMDPGLVLRQVPQVLIAASGAGHRPAGPVELARKLPILRGPDVLCMGRAGPGYAGDYAGIVRYRGRRVNEVGMQPRGVFRPFGDEHQRLTKTAEAVA